MAAAHLKISTTQDEVLVNEDVSSIAIGHETVSWVVQQDEHSFDDHSIDIFLVKELVITPILPGHHH